MSDYDQGANDTMLGFAIGNASTALFERFQAKKHNQEVQEAFDELRAKNAHNYEQAVAWRDRALKAERANKMLDDHSHDLTEKLTRTERKLKETEKQKEEIKLEAAGWESGARKNRAASIRNAWKINKHEAMQLALRENIDDLFEADKVDYPKDQFDQEVNADYIQKRLKMDQEYHSKLNDSDDRFPADEYIDQQKERISGSIR